MKNKKRKTRPVKRKNVRNKKIYKENSLNMENKPGTRNILANVPFYRENKSKIKERGRQKLNKPVTK